VCESCIAGPQAHAAEHFCSQCRTPFLNRFPLDLEGRCALCRAGARGFDAAYCFGFHEGNLRELVRLLKYDGMRPLAEPLGDLLHRALPLDEPFDAFVPVPLHWLKKFQRGFNQSELLAARLASRRRTPVLDALRRVKMTGAQAGLTNAARRRNVAGAFRARRRVDGLRLVLIDDVTTTGATASACASALKRAGAKSVTLLTVARVDRRAASPAPPPALFQAMGASQI
jgi:ComF family protein